MRNRNYYSALLAVVMIVLAIAMANSQSGSGSGHEVIPVEGNDFICHFENEYCGTANGTISFCAGAWNLGICTEGGGYIDLGDADRYSAELIEIECQVIFSQLPGQGSHAAALVTKYSNGNPAISEWGLFVEGNLTATPSWLLTGDGTNGIYSDGGVEINTLYWVRAVICRNGNGWIYVNGQRVAQGVLTINSSNTSTPVRIANSFSGTNYFYGMLDEVRIGVFNSVGVEESSWGAIKSLYR